MKNILGKTIRLLSLVPMCRIYYLAVALVLLVWLLTRITGPTTLYPSEGGELDEEFKRPGYFTLLIMLDNGRWHRLFQYDEKDANFCMMGRYLRDYKNNPHKFYTGSNTGWSDKRIGPMVFVSTSILFLLVILSPFLYDLARFRALIITLMLIGLFGYSYWLFLESRDEVLYNVFLQSGEYDMIWPCFFAAAGYLYRICIRKKLQFDKETARRYFTEIISSHRAVTQRCFSIPLYCFVAIIVAPNLFTYMAYDCGLMIVEPWISFVYLNRQLFYPLLLFLLGFAFFALFTRVRPGIMAKILI